MSGAVSPGVTIDQPQDPTKAMWPDPSDPTRRHCEANITARVQALAPGQYHLATTVSVDDPRSWAGPDRHTSALFMRGTGTPPAPPVPPVEPPPAATTSPNNSLAPPLPSIVDASGATWTIGPSKETLRNGVHIGAGYGTKLLWYNAAVYAFGTDSAWYKWGTVWEYIGATQPGTGTTPPATVTSVTFAPDKASPQVAGTIVRFTATPVGGTAPVQYEFTARNGNGAWQVIKTWSADNTAEIAAAAGDYLVRVEARSAGATTREAFTDYLFTFTAPQTSDPLAEIAKLQAQVTALQSQVTSTQAQLTQAQGNLNAVTMSLNTATAQVTAMTSQRDEAVRLLQASVAHYAQLKKNSYSGWQLSDLHAALAVLVR